MSADGKVTYSFHKEVWGDWSEDADEFDIDEYVQFDYTDPQQIPQGITVTQDVSGKYTLNGTGSAQASNHSTKMTFDGFEFTYVPGIIVEVSGKVVLEEDYGDEKEKTVTDITTADGKVKYTHYSYDRQFTESGVSKAEFVGINFEEFRASTYAGCTITPCDAETFHGKKCDVVLINGQSTGSNCSYENYKVYTYKGYIVKESSIADGEKENIVYSYYYE